MLSGFGSPSSFSSSNLIYRDLLVKKIQNKTNKKNCYITAPGGYGKTIASAQWLASVNGTVEKLTVKDASNSADDFYYRLILSLMKMLGIKKPVPNATLTLKQFLKTLTLMPAKHKRCYIVIDDLHLLKNENILQSIPLLATHLPRYICLCLVSRSAPSPQLLKTNLFEVIDKSDLLFSAEEAEWLGAEYDLALTPEQIRELLEITGGWAIYISAILSDGIFHKTPQALEQYMETRVWRLWDRNIQELLLRIAIPEEITPLLCKLLTGRNDGYRTLEDLIRVENAFLSCIGDGIYRFHDVFREFILKKAVGNLGENELRNLNDSIAGWYYKKGDFYTSMRYYIQNLNHEGISRCILASMRNITEMSLAPIECWLNYMRKFVMELPVGVILENPFLLYISSVAAYYSGDAKTFLYYLDKLKQKLPEISLRYPELSEVVTLFFIVDYRISINEYLIRLNKSGALTNKKPDIQSFMPFDSISQVLPFIHRSVRDFSEYCELRTNNLGLLESYYYVYIGSDYRIINQLLSAGIYYERGLLLDAARCALNAYHSCGNGTRPETSYSAHIILWKILSAMGDSFNANQVMVQTEGFIKEHSQFRLENFKAFQVENSLRSGDTDTARKWLDAYRTYAEKLSFYQIHQHFTTLRSYIALGCFSQAWIFGKKLNLLAKEYNRPLDKIESNLLMAIALWRYGMKEEATQQIKQTIDIAMPYGFTQLFVNEGKDILPLLFIIRKNTDRQISFQQFVDKLLSRICSIYGYELEHEHEPPQPLLSTRYKILKHLSEGKSYNEIASEIGLTLGTTKTHIGRTYKQLGVHSAAEAIEKARMIGLLE